MAVLTKITSRSLGDNAVTSAHVQGDVIAAGDIAAGAVGSSELAADAVIAGKVADGAIDVAAALGSNVVTQAKVADDAIGADELAANAVVDASVASGAAIAVGKLAGTASRALETSGTGAVQVSATTTTELAKIAGLTASTAELNKTAGLTPTTAELNILDSSVSGPLQHRNMITNGAMQVFQRATATTNQTNNWSTSTADRWIVYIAGNMAVSTERYAMTLPDINTTGHHSAIKLNVTTADTNVAGGDYVFLRQGLEGQDLQRLQYGTAAAKNITLSFWCKSNVTGAYCVVFNKATSTRVQVVKEYTINAADTWEKKTITVTPTDGSTNLIAVAGGIIGNNTSAGMEINFTLMVGDSNEVTKDIWLASSSAWGTNAQPNWAGAVNNNFYLTGVQLELGSTATAFEHRHYGDELRRCQRYYCQFPGRFADTGWLFSMPDMDMQMSVTITYPVTMRAAPTVSIGTQQSRYWENSPLTLNRNVLTTSEHECGFKRAGGGDSKYGMLVANLKYQADL